MVANSNFGGGYLKNTNKKGFTLIELLAVIVILAIIALIAVPIVLNMIEDARKSAAVDSTYGYIKAVEYEIGLDELKNKNRFKDGKQDIEEIKINLKGTKPSYGEIEIKNKNVIYANVCINGYMVTYENEKAKAFDKCTGKYDKTGPEIVIGKVSGTTNSLTIEYEVIDKESEIKETKCYYEIDKKYENEGKIENNKCVITGLKNNTTYNYKIEATNAGGITSTKEGSEITGNFESINFEVTPLGDVWSQEKKVTITGSTEGSKLQYRILVNDGETTTVKVDWTDYTDVLIIDWESTEQKPTRIDARLFDGENESEWASLTLMKIAKAPTCSLEVDSYTLNSVSVITNCESTIGIKEYFYSIDDSEYVSSTNNKYTFDSIHVSTIKVKILDEADNEIVIELTEDEKNKVYNGIYILLDERTTTLENNTFLHQYPVGSIYITTSSAENTVDKVASKYGGTWEAFGTNKVLRGTTGTSEQTGGTTGSVTLATTNLPSHTHSIPALSGTAASYGSGYTINRTYTNRTSSVPSTNETISGYYSGIALNYGLVSDGYYAYLRKGTTAGNLGTLSGASTSKTHTHTVADYYVSSISGVQAHSHSVTTKASTSGSTGSTTPTAFSTMDSYITVYMYKRLS